MTIDPRIARVLADAVHGAAAPATPSPDSAQKFAELMKAGAPPESEAGLDTTVGDALLRQDEAMRANFKDAHALAAREEGQPGMSTAEQMEMMYRLTVAGFQFNSVVALAQSGKNGLQTLMRNQ